ncbi:MAG: ABC transporter permease [Proteobacteria bacterium]|nr:ABC transporter permease [Pseudomonadota bacterium]
MSVNALKLRGSNVGGKISSYVRGALSVKTLEGIVSLVAFVALWQAAVSLRIPYISNLPFPGQVWNSLGEAAGTSGYWLSWVASLKRILISFIIAQVVGVPLGLFMGMSKPFRQLIFPVFEIVRPIPPIAWIPLAILFWPTEELSIYALTFIGPFFVIVLNVMQGVASIDQSFKRAALSLGAKPSDIFWKIMLPGALPSILTGMTVGIGVAWNVLIAAEMIAGRNGLGRMTWEAYTNGNIPLIIVGMISIGVAGYLCSSLVRLIGENCMPWQRRF